MERLTSTTTRIVEVRNPGPFTRLLMLVLFAALTIIALIILIPLLLIALALGLLILLYLKVRALFTKAHTPNGPLDGRHNVKVINRDE